MLLLAACGRKDSAAAPEETVTVPVTTGVPTTAASYQDVYGPVLPDGTKQEGFLRDNIYFWEIVVGEKTTINRTLTRLNGEQCKLRITSIALNAMDYPYEILLTTPEGEPLYHLYTVEKGDEAFIYEEQQGEKRFVGARGKYYCPWFSLGSGERPELRMQELLESLSNLSVTPEAEDVSILCRSADPVDTESVGCVGSVKMLLTSDFTVPGTLLSDEAFALYEKNGFTEKLSVNEEENPIREITTDVDSYRIYQVGDEIFLKDSSDATVLTLGAGKARWGNDEYFIREGYEEPMIAGQNMTDFFDGHQDANPSKEESAMISWIRTGTFEELLESSGYLEKMQEYPASSLTYGWNSYLLFGWATGEAGSRTDRQMFGDAYEVLLGPLNEGQPRGDVVFTEDGIHYEFSGTRYEEEYFMKRAKFGNLEMISQTVEGEECLDITLTGMYLGFEAQLRVLHFPGFPQNLSLEYVKDYQGRIVSEIYYAGSYEFARVNYVYDRDGDYTVPAGKICMEYSYICGIPVRKAVHFYCPDNPDVCVICDDVGEATILFGDGQTAR
jgi:hypothetical protein